MNNSLAQATQKPKFSVVLQSDAMKNLINNTLGDKAVAQKFVAAISSAVAQNPALQDCDSKTIISAGLVGEALNLSPSSFMGQYYLVPFNDKKNGRIVAQFQIGYKGYIQLAMRSGEYKKLNVLAIKKGELIKFDPLNEEIEVKLIENDEVREATETIGYYAMFEYINGFRKAIYWSKAKMEAHALKYSQGYRADKNKGTAFTFWSKDFDGMAYKTMLRQLISKWGIMSINLEKALVNDMGVIDENNNIDYVDNEANDINDTPVEAAPVIDPVYAEVVEGKQKTSEAEEQQPVQEDKYTEGLFEGI